VISLFLPSISATAVQKPAIAAIHKRASATDEITNARSELTVSVPFLGYDVCSEEHNSDLALRCAAERSIERLQSSHMQKSRVSGSACCTPCTR
jgi:hypothetical protein